MTETHSRTDEPTDVLVVTQRFSPESMAGSHRWEKIIENTSSEVACRVVCPHPSVPVGEFDRNWKLWDRDRAGDIPVTRLWTYQPIEDRTNLERILNHVIFAVFASLYVLVYGRKYDCVIVQIGPHTTLLPGITAKLIGRPLIVDSFDLWLDNAANLGFVDTDSLSYTVVERIEQFALEHCDHLTVITPTMGRQFQQKYDIEEAKWSVLPFGVDPALFDPDATVTETSRIVYTGKLGEGQAFEPFLRGFSALETDHELEIYGFGERHEELRDLCNRLGIADRVQIHDPIPREEVPALVASSMVSLVPLKTEYALDYARPTKLLETMALGTPYIASNVTEIETVTTRSEAGIVVENEAAAVHDAFSELLSDPDQRLRMGERGIGFIDEHHRWGPIGETAEELVTTVTTNAA